MSKIPSKNRHWLKEVKRAYAKAEKKHLKSNTDLLDVYKLAPEYVARNRGFDSEEKINAILQAAIDDLKYGMEIDPGCEINYLFHFVSTYIMGHSVIELVDEMEADKIMHYINEEWDLFPNT